MTEEMMNKKIEYWKHRLLDLGKRNRMINYRETRRSTLKLTDPDLETLYRRLVTQEASLSFRRPIDRRSEGRVFAMLTLMRELGHPLDVTVGDIGYAVSSEDALAALRNMRSRATLALEEQGSNILYLSFGFLEWRERQGEDSPILRSPLLMVPVTLSVASLNAPFVLKKRDEDIVVNPTLAYYFESEFHIKLPPFDESAEDVIAYMEKVESFAESLGFSVVREVSLGLLSFLKISMYKDMEINDARIKENAVIRAMAGERALSDAFFEREAEETALKEHPRQVFLVLSADTSQQEAIRASKEGVSFVMQGPPGTGKSQTIANMIAEALADGKKVLFVSEKTAALQVVHRRLSEVGLADFCLPLHSHKANKREILSEIGANLKLKAPKVSDASLQALEMLAFERDKLDGYVEALHRVIEPLGKSAYEVYGILAASEGVVSLPYTEIEPLQVDAAMLYRREALLEAYREALAALGGTLKDNPWAGLCEEKSGYAFERDLHRLLMMLLTGVTAMDGACDKLARFKGKEVTLSRFPSFAETVRAFYTFGPLPAAWQRDEASLNEAIQFAEEANETLKAFRKAESVCNALFYSDAFTADLDALYKRRLSLAGDLLRLPLYASSLKGGFEEKRRQLLASCERLLDASRALSLAVKTYLDTVKEAETLLSLSLPYDARASEALEEWIPLLRDSRCLIPTIAKDDIPYLRSLVARVRSATSGSKIWERSFYEERKALSALRTVFGGAANDCDAMEASLAFAEEVYRVKADPSEALKSLLAKEAREATLGEAMVLLYRMRQALLAVEEAFQALAGMPLDQKTELALLTDTLGESVQRLEALNEVSHSLNAYLKQPMPSEAALCDSCQLMQEYRRLSRLAAQRKKAVETAFGSLYKGRELPLESLLLYLKTYRSFGGKVPSYETLEAEKAAAYAALGQAERAYEAIKGHLHSLDAFFEGTSLFDFTPHELHARFGAMLRSVDKIERYRAYAAARREALEEGLGEFLEAYEAYYNEHAEESVLDVAAIYRKSFYTAWAEARRAEAPALRLFDKKGQEERIKRFASLDERSLVTARKRIRARLIEAFPSTDRALRAGDELTVLERELQKRRGIMPLRKLFRSIPHLLMKLKPCLMMSPLSVSYFLEAKTYHFDLVIFDEASQIFPEDAIGALCRADRAVIVGDSKQLPPTNFFASHASSEDESDEEDYEEALEESILEKAAACLPARTLLWHYRSRHEHLIAFSNREIYQNSLITFPSAEEKTPDFGIEYIYVPNGVYEGGGKNHNLTEAATCVRLVEEHILRRPERSLGIIAFSEKQQRAIEDAIEHFREEHPAYEFFFTENKDEPFFVKNLENVQGDERDTIFFSIGYGKDRKGRMYMRFGPLGHEGGERRLNVAITRAKQNVKLIGSILPADIDLSRTQSEGVRMLRAYIEFAISGESALAKEKNALYHDDDPFADTVADFLSENGYTVKRRVGCSEYKVEIAVMHPQRQGEILAGVECDGRIYAEAGAARDRDHLVAKVMKGMGWRLIRVWSSAWVQNRAKEEKALLAFLDACMQDEKTEEPIMPLSFEQDAPEEEATVPVYERQTDGNGADKAESATDEAEGTSQSEASGPPERDANGFAYYREANWADAAHSASRDHETVIAERIFYLVQEEAPLHKELLYRRMATAFRSGKVNEGVRSAVDKVLEGLLSTVVFCDERGFLTLKSTKIEARVPMPGRAPRPMEYICREEVADAMLRLLAITVGITVEDLFSETARVFGFERMGQKIKAKLDEALFSLMMAEKIALSDGKVELKKSLQ